MKKLRLWPFVLAIPAAFLLGKCSGSGDIDSGQPMSTDSIVLYKAKIANLEANLMAQKDRADKEKELKDSLSKIKIQIVARYIKVSNSVEPIDTVGCTDLYLKFQETVKAADSLNTVNDSIIASQERRDTALLSVISIQHDQLGLKDSIIQEQATGLENQAAALKKANRKVRRNRVIVGACAILAGIGFAF